MPAMSPACPRFGFLVSGVSLALGPGRHSGVGPSVYLLSQESANGSGFYDFTGQQQWNNNLLLAAFCFVVIQSFGSRFYPIVQSTRDPTRTTANVASSVWCPCEKPSTVLKMKLTRSPTS